MTAVSETTDPGTEATSSDAAEASDAEPTLEVDLAIIADVAAELEAVEAELVAMDQERDGDPNPT